MNNQYTFSKESDQTIPHKLMGEIASTSIAIGGIASYYVGLRLIANRTTAYVGTYKREALVLLVKEKF